MSWSVAASSLEQSRDDLVTAGTSSRTKLLPLPLEEKQHNAKLKRGHHLWEKVPPALLCSMHCTEGHLPVSRQQQYRFSLLPSRRKVKKMCSTRPLKIPVKT